MCLTGQEVINLSGGTGVLVAFQAMVLLSPRAVEANQRAPRRRGIYLFALFNKDI